MKVLGADLLEGTSKDIDDGVHGQATPQEETDLRDGVSNVDWEMVRDDRRMMLAVYEFGSTTYGNRRYTIEVKF